MRLLFPLALSLAAACGGDDHLEPPTCAEGEVRFEGDVDGVTFHDARSGFSSYLFENAPDGELGQVDIEFPDREDLWLGFREPVASGDSVPARGSVNYASRLLDYHNCGDDFPGTLWLDDDGDGGSFRLTNLRSGFDSCAIGSDLDGEIVGCFRPE